LELGLLTEERARTYKNILRLADWAERVDPRGVSEEKTTESTLRYKVIRRDGEGKEKEGEGPSQT
jgi:hypothetical protein